VKALVRTGQRARSCDLAHAAAPWRRANDRRRKRLLGGARWWPASAPTCAAGRHFAAVGPRLQAQRRRPARGAERWCSSRPCSPRGATVRAYDPVAMPALAAAMTCQARTGSRPDATAQGADALVVVTEWRQFRSPVPGAAAGAARAGHRGRPQPVRPRPLAPDGIRAPRRSDAARPPAPAGADRRRARCGPWPREPGVHACPKLRHGCPPALAWRTFAPDLFRDDGLSPLAGVDQRLTPRRPGSRACARPPAWAGHGRPAAPRAAGRARTFVRARQRGEPTRCGQPASGTPCQVVAVTRQALAGGATAMTIDLRINRLYDLHLALSRRDPTCHARSSPHLP
jgi:hypothetical protein